jgi:NAD(P)-dependent dehydrogenase (short-subunit alcohol dehydrogenase family)
MPFQQSTVLNNKVALVTGARSERGIGYASACALAAAGADVVITSRFAENDERFPGFEALANNIADEYGVRCLAMAMDVVKRDQVQRVIDACVKELGGLDILFNNAGMGFGELFVDMTPEQLQGIWDVNVMGSFHTTQLVIPEMIKRGGGSIINNASIYGLGTDPYISGYCMTKHAIVAMTKALAQEVGEQGIRVNSVCPGMIVTEMGDLEYQDIADIEGISFDEAKTYLASKNALKRGGEPEEVGNVVAFLASPQSGYISGVNMPVSAGQPVGL